MWLYWRLFRLESAVRGAGPALGLRTNAVAVRSVRSLTVHDAQDNNRPHDLFIIPTHATAATA